MRWSHLNRLRSYVRASLWIVPFFAIPLEMITTRILHRLDGAVDWNVFHFGMLGALDAGNHSNRISFICCFHFWVAACRHPGRKRAIDAPHHRYDVAAK